MTSSASIAWWPRCTPSKLPIVSAQAGAMPGWWKPRNTCMPAIIGARVAVAAASDWRPASIFFQKPIVADSPAIQVRPGAGSKKRALPSLTITEPA